MRGGTSKGAYFLASDLPTNTAARDDLLLRVMGSPDPRQIDGIGGADPLTSKVAILAPSARDDADVDEFFVVEQPSAVGRERIVALTWLYP
jgi:4-oxalomesaconate tautomerase